MSSEDDEWEKAELDLMPLKIESDKASKPSQPSVVIPARLLSRPINHEINFFPVQDVPAPAAATQSPPVLTVPAQDDPIDTTLLEAAKNLQERRHVLQIENSMINFVKSGDRYLDVAAGLNAFRRLLVYRIAQRFRLRHEVSGTGIVLHRTSDTRIPKQLLIDIPVEADPMVVSTSTSASSSSGRLDEVPPLSKPIDQSSKASTTTPVSVSGAASAAASNGTPAQGSGPKKLMVMTRPQNRNDDASKNKGQSQRPTTTAADKERQYQEARARIFGDSMSSGVTGSTDSASKGGVTSGDSGKNTSGSETGKAGANGTNASKVARPQSSVANSPIVSKAKGGSSSAESQAGASPTAGTKGKQSNGSSSSGGSSKGAEVSGTSAASPNGKAKAKSGVDSPSSSSPTPLANTSNAALQQSSSHSSSSTSSSAEKSSAVAIAAPISRDSSSESLSSGKSGGADIGSGTSSTSASRRKVVDAASWKEKKSTMRDIEAERSDPDFARRNITVTPAPFPAQSGSTAASNGSGGSTSSSQQSSKQQQAVSQGQQQMQQQQQQQQHQQAQHVQHQYMEPYGQLPAGAYYAGQEMHPVYAGPPLAYGHMGGQYGVVPSGMYPLPVAPTLQMSPHMQSGGGQGGQAWPPGSPVVIGPSGTFFQGVPMGVPLYPASPQYAQGYIRSPHPQQGGNYSHMQQQQQQSAASQSRQGSQSGQIFSNAEFPPLGH